MSFAGISEIEGVAGGRLLRACVVAAVAAAAANVVLFALTKGLLNIPLMIPPQPGAGELVPLTVGPVILMSVVPAVLATGLLGLLGRLVSRPIRVFWVVAALGLLLSFAPFPTIQVGVSVKIGLGLMHVMAAAIIVGVLTTQSREP